MEKTHPEYQYLTLLEDILKNGIDSTDRTGTGTKSVFGRQIRFDLADGFPLITTKKIHWKSVVIELLWLMKGLTNIEFLKKHNVRIWDEWADASGNLGPVYGQQWRAWKTDDYYHDFTHSSSWYMDQLSEVIQRIKDKPDCRRLIVSAWNAPMIKEMALPPCHTLFQFYVRNGKLSCQLYQRSADVFLGVPFNIASYALLTTLIANECELEVGEFIHTFGDVHIYNNHIDQVKEQLTRQPKKMPRVDVSAITPGHLMDFVDNMVDNYDSKTILSDFIELIDYDSHPTIKGEVSV